MTLGGAAQHMNTEGARARDHREQALKHFEGRKAIGTLIQLVGSLLLAYLPTVILVFYETISNHVAHPLALKASLLCLSTAAPVNSFLFGIRNKSIQMILINFVRKELYKNEVQQEIRQRSPGLAGSTRPSMTSIVGQITCQVPYLQRHVSFASLMAVSLCAFPHLTQQTVPVKENQLRNDSIKLGFRKQQSVLENCKNKKYRTNHE